MSSPTLSERNLNNIRMQYYSSLEVEDDDSPRDQAG